MTRQVSSNAKRAEIAVGVRSRVGEHGSAEDDVTVGVLVGSTVVAFPIEQELDFRPTEVEAVIATFPLGANGTVERIPATRVDILAPPGPAIGRKVVFITLAHPCTQFHDLPETSPSQLLAAIRDAEDFWSAVTTVSRRGAGSLPELPDHIVRRIGRHKIPGPRPTVRTRVAQSTEQLSIDWCDITPACAPTPD